MAGKRIVKTKKVKTPIVRVGPKIDLKATIREAKKSGGRTDPRIDEMVELMSASEKVAKRLAEIKAEVLNELETDTATFVTEEGHAVKVTKVAGSSIVMDEERLRKSVGATIWNKITSRNLDKKLLEKAVSEGTVTAGTLAEVSTEKPIKPYLKVTVK